MSRKKLAYCDVCHKKIMPLTDEDFAYGASHCFRLEPEGEPPTTDPRQEIELFVRARTIRHEDSRDMCRACVEKMLREVLSE